MSDEVSLLQAFSRSSHPGRNGSQRDTVVVVGPRVRPEGLNRPQRTRRRFYYKKYRSYSGRQRRQELVGSSLYIDLRLYLFQCHVESRSYDWTAFVPPRGGTRLPANVTFSVKRAECSKKERNRIPMGIISSGRSFVPTVGHTNAPIHLPTQGVRTTFSPRFQTCCGG